PHPSQTVAEVGERRRRLFRTLPVAEGRLPAGDDDLADLALSHRLAVRVDELDEGADRSPEWKRPDPGLRVGANHVAERRAALGAAEYVDDLRVGREPAPDLGHVFPRGGVAADVDRRNAFQDLVL